MTTIRERPILFSAPMVQAIQAGRKTQTRRLVKLRDFGPSSTPGYDWCFRRKDGCWEEYTTADLIAKHCPYGVIGDRLWVRETFRYVDFECLPGLNGQDVRWNAAVEYRDGVRGLRTDNVDPSTRLGWRPSIHMPRWASRILLEITDVKVERLNDISEADAIAEGARDWLNGLDGRTYDNAEKQACRFTKVLDPQAGMMSSRGAFATLWESLHGKGSWAANPWLWVITFREVGK